MHSSLRRIHPAHAFSFGHHVQMRSCTLVCISKCMILMTCETFLVMSLLPFEIYLGCSAKDSQVLPKSYIPSTALAVETTSTTSPKWVLRPRLHRLYFACSNSSLLLSCLGSSHGFFTYCISPTRT